MASEQDKQYTCIREKQLGKHESDIAQLRVRADFKDDSIKEIKADMEKMNDKLDHIDDKIEKFMRKSVEDDASINNRVTALENTVKVLKWVSGISISFLAMAITALGFALTHFH